MRIWIVACLLAITVPPLLYGDWIDARLLRHDPDTIPASRELMQFATRFGAMHYARHCASCHGSRGRGDTLRGVPDLTDADWLYGEGEVSEIERTIAYGIRSDNSKAWNLAIMPAYARPQPSPSNPRIAPLAPQEIRDVVDYLYLLEGRPHDATAAARGAAIFGNTGGCYDCHTADGHGDPAIGAPNLTDRVSLYGDGSRDALFRSIAEGNHGVCPAWIDRMSPVALRETALYVYSLSHRP